MAETKTECGHVGEPGARDLAKNGAKVEPVKPDAQCLQNSIAKWLGAMAQAQAAIADARAAVDRDIAALQVSIMLAQDNLSPDNKVGQRALVRKISCAEDLNQTARRFDRLAADIGCLATIIRKLADVMITLSVETPALLLAPMPSATALPAVVDRVTMASQLATIKNRVEQLGGATNDKPLGELWVCILSLRPVVVFLAQQTVDIMAKLRALSTVIGGFDREIMLSRST